MKKIFLLAVVCLLLVGCSSAPKKENKYGCDTLKVFNTGVYIGDNVVSDFEKEYGVKVIYDLFASNEEMYTKLLGGETYDILYPSDYMIERLISENKLQKLDKSLLVGLDTLQPDVLGLPFDKENEYAVPYMYGNVGIVYNKNNVSEDDLKNQGYNIFLNQKYKGKNYMYDSQRDAFMVAFKALGYSMNTEKEEEINAAYEWLMKFKTTMDTVLVDDQVIDGMINEEKDIALMYSGDATYVISENSNLGFFMPESGTNLWTDAMVIPSDSKCPLLAHEWMNYNLREDIATRNSTTIGYTSSVKKVADQLYGAGGAYEGIDAYVVRKNENDEVFVYSELLKKKLDDLWTRVKAHN
ncbi:MAG: ABC transporter substrate-binding protein [Erysipelotrichaceae bacterium]